MKRMVGRRGGGYKKAGFSSRKAFFFAREGGSRRATPVFDYCQIQKGRKRCGRFFFPRMGIGVEVTVLQARRGGGVVKLERSDIKKTVKSQKKVQKYLSPFVGEKSAHFFWEIGFKTIDGGA